MMMQGAGITIQMLRRELLLRYKTPGMWLNAVVLFVMILLVFAFAVGASSHMLHDVAAAAVWIAALFSILLGSDSLFVEDYRDGTLEQLIVSRQSLGVWVLIKVLVQWLTGGALISGLSLFSSMLFGLSQHEVLVLLATLLPGTAILSLFAALVSALTLSLHTRSLLIPLIAMPLQLPVIIFATGALKMVSDTPQVVAIVCLLLAGLIVSVVFLPWFMALALRQAMH